MNDQLIKTIRSRIQKAGKSIVENDDANLKRYPAAIKQVLMDELRQEVATLNEMLKDPQTFKSKLRERCSARSHDKTSIPLNCLTDTPTNKLYWDLATLVFEPKNMQKMLAIMQPDVEFQLGVQTWLEHNDVIPLASQPLALKELPPSFAELSHFVMTVDTLLDMRELEKLSPVQRKQAESYIRTKLPDVQARMNERDSISVLKEYSEEQSGLSETPRTVIKHFYQAGDELKTGTEDYIVSRTRSAINEFKRYLETLDDDARNTVRSLKRFKSDTQTLGDLIDTEITGYQQSRALFDSLRMMLNNTAQYDELDARLALQQDEIEASTAHRKTVKHVLPEKLMNQMLNYLCSQQSFIKMLQDFPVSFYDFVLDPRLWQMMEHDDNIRKGYLTRFQIREFVATLTRHYVYKQPLLKWMLEINNDDALQSFIDSLTDEEAVDLLSTYKNSHGQNALHLCRTPKQVSIILDKLPEKTRYSLMLARDHIGGSAVIEHLENKKTEIATLAYITNDELFMQVLADSGESTDVLHSLLHIKSVLTDSRKIALAQAAGRVFGKRVLSHNWLRQAESVAELKAAIPSNLSAADEVAYYLSSDRLGQTILHLNYNPDVIAHVLSKIPKHEIYDALTKKDLNGLTPLHRAQSDELRKQLIAAIPEDCLCYAIALCTGGNGTLLFNSTSNEEMFAYYLRTIPEHHRYDAAVRFSGHAERTSLVYHVVSKHSPTLLRILLTSLPVTKRYPALVNGHNHSKIIILEEISQDMQLMAVVADLLPEADLKKLLLHPFNKMAERVIDTICKNSWRKNSDVMQKIILKLSPESLTEMFLPEVKSDAPDDMWRHVSNSFPELIPVIIQRMPENIRERAIHELIAAVDFRRNNGFDWVKPTLALLPDDRRLVAAAKIIRRATEQDDYVLKTILDLNFIDENKLLEAGQLRLHPEQTVEKTALDYITEYPKKLQVWMNALPAHERLRCLDVELSDGRTVLQQIVNQGGTSRSYIAFCLQTLSDEQQELLLLKEVDGATVLQHYVRACGNTYSAARYIPISFNDWYIATKCYDGKQGSFFHQILAITSYMNYENEGQRANAGFLYRMFCNNEAGMLLAKLYECQSADDFKSTLLEYFNTPNSKYTKEILECQLPANAPQALADKLKMLEQLWEMGAARIRHDKGM